MLTNNVSNKQKKAITLLYSRTRFLLRLMIKRKIAGLGIIVSLLYFCLIPVLTISNSSVIILSTSTISSVEMPLILLINSINAFSVTGL